MSIPSYQELYPILLDSVRDECEYTMREVRDRIAGTLKLTEDEREILIPSGRQRLFDNRVGWAKTYLVKAGLLEQPRRGTIRLTERGLQALKLPQDDLNNNLLKQYPEFNEFYQRGANGVDAEPINHQDIDQEQTPEELIEGAYEQLRAHLEEELLDSIKNCSPTFFEHLVVDLLIKMGYGGSRKDAGEAIGKSGDGGIDGIIKEDKLGLDAVYIQAKRWDSNNSVGRPEVQKFAGALQGFRAKKGVFITTSKFSTEAKEFAGGVDTRIVLINGRELTKLMVDHGLGCTTEAVYEVKRLDTDYFDDEVD